jgi:hypothetical protein
MLRRTLRLVSIQSLDECQSLLQSLEKVEWGEVYVQEVAGQ